MIIKTIEDFIKYVKIRLGYPIVNINLTDEQIKLIIEDSLEQNHPHFIWGNSTILKSTKDEIVNNAYDLWIRILKIYKLQGELDEKIYTKDVKTIH